MIAKQNAHLVSNLKKLQQDSTCDMAFNVCGHQVFAHSVVGKWGGGRGGGEEQKEEREL